MNLFQKIIFAVGSLTLLSGLVVGYIVINGALANPTAPNPSSGQTIPYTVKGKLVFISNGQYVTILGTYAGEVLGVVLLVLSGAPIVFRKTAGRSPR